MKKRAKLTMSSLTLTLLCCYSCMLAVASGLPITSKPLDNSPDHLTWQAAWLSGDSRPSGMGGKAKKIPKSIFIAPQLNGYNGSLCPPDTKIDYNGKCIHVVNINTADILVTKLQSILGNGGGTPNAGGEDDYDYDDDTSGPFQVNLPLSIDLPFEQPLQQSRPVDTFYDTTVEDRLPSSVRASVKQSTVDSVNQQSTFPIQTSKQPTDQTPAETHTDISFLAFESLPNGTLSTQLELDGNNGTVVQNIVLTSTSVAPPTVSLDPVYADFTISTSTNGVASTDTTSTVLSTTTEELSTPTTTETVSLRESGSSMSTGNTDSQATDSSFSTSTAPPDSDGTDTDLEDLKSELAEESLLLEPNAFATTDVPSDANTEQVGFFSTGSTSKAGRYKPTESSTLPEPTTTKVLIHTMPPALPQIQSTPKPVQIVTPLRSKWYSPPGATPPPFIVASYTQQDRTTRATPETTTVPQQRSTETPLLVLVNDTDVDKRNRVSIHRQEMKENLRETMDTNNRFVYHHLPAPSTVATTTADHNYVDQLRKINEIVAENNQRHQQNSRIRFPTRSDDQQTAAATNHNMVRFPGSVSNRVTQHASRLPDIFPKKTSTESTTQRPPFWWLPSGWEVDQTGQKPMLLRFWSRMPLVRDQSLTTSTSSSNDSRSSSSRWRPASVGSTGHTSPSSGTPRGNSRSPSENFYKEVSSQDIYKVLNMRQLKHKR
ncbi:uncharacterized protein LOC131439412 [Malaya genurostris]|uniref:uncharacterized protein LOC131439412 n=1 Tax=Malaya genurostris TaxID=325434 RepID=UPI0026F3ECC8|nr:uncharacterized protein LOC131439412 [Malaya genurostris]